VFKVQKINTFHADFQRLDKKQNVFESNYRVGFSPFNGSKMRSIIQKRRAFTSLINKKMNPSHFLIEAQTRENRHQPSHS
jgi:hypothetical protein